MTAEDPLRTFQGKSSCPVCGCIESKGSVRCAECGTFHSGIHLEEREAPPPGTLPEREVIDPMVYSLSDNHAIPNEEFRKSKKSHHGKVAQPISQWMMTTNHFQELTLMNLTCLNRKYSVIDF